VAILKITEAVRVAARKALQNPGLKLDRSDRDVLAAVAGGKRKQLDVWWWRKIHRVVDQSKLDKLARLADPERNSNEHERAVAADKLKAFKGRRPPGLSPVPPPFDWGEAVRKRAEAIQQKQQQRRKPRKTEPAPQAPPRHSPKGDGGVNKGGVNKGGVNKGGVNKGGVNKRSGDRHLNKGDRHAPGYMRDYMRRRRAKAEETSKDDPPPVPRFEQHIQHRRYTATLYDVITGYAAARQRGNRSSSITRTGRDHGGRDDR
jgi:hypothetical protein